MPQIPFKSESRAVKVGQIDKLSLQHGEYARVVLLESPTFRYIHNLRAPKIGVDGKPIQISKKGRSRGGAEGDTYTTWEMDFIGRPFCLGKEEILAEKGVDPDNCPACKRSIESNQVKAPERRFAVNVIRYQMDSRGQQSVPFSCTSIPWAFNESTFDKLVGIAEEYQASGGLVGRDLRFGPCTSKDFQNFEITPGDQSWWGASEDNKQRVVQTYTANKKTDKELESLCGREVSAAWLSEDLGKIADKWRVVDSGGAERPDATAALDKGTVSEGLADLLNTPAAVTSEHTPVVQGSMPNELADLLSDSGPKPNASITPTAGGEPVGFGSILDELAKLGS